MPCPYAKRRGAVIYCEAAKKIVNPLTHPCLSRSRYTRCKYYRAAQEARETRAEEKPAQAQTSAAAPPPATSPPKPQPASAIPSTAREERPPAPPASKPPEPAKPVAPRTRGLTLDGRPARNCLECIYYGRKTSICLLLGVEVRDPNRPPCAES